VGEIDIFILNRQNERRFGIKLIEAFPKTIGATPLSHENQNAIITLPITFVFRYWETLDVNRAPNRATSVNPDGPAGGTTRTSTSTRKTMHTVNGEIHEGHGPHEPVKYPPF